MIAWKDKAGKEYYMKEIDDRYLMNIIGALKKGVGDKWFVNPAVIDALCEEAFSRGLMSADEAHAAFHEIHLLWSCVLEEFEDAIEGKDDLSLYQD